MADRIRLLVVDDHALFRKGIVELLRDEAQFEVVGEANNGVEALQLQEQQQPHVILMDVHMPDGNGVDAVKRLKQSSQVYILMLTISDKDDDLLSALDAGADGYLLKNTEPEELLRAIQQVAAGHGVLSPEITARVMQRAVKQQQSSTSPLSPREQGILMMLSQGANTAKIATQLVISENTVKTHVRRILQKLDAANRSEAVAIALKNGLLSDE
jgi:DNA-binding NarL/FixJ family response regulator